MSYHARLICSILPSKNKQNLKISNMYRMISFLWTHWWRGTTMYLCILLNIYVEAQKKMQKDTEQTD